MPIVCKWVPVACMTEKTRSLSLSTDRERRSLKKLVLANTPVKSPFRVWSSFASLLFEPITSAHLLFSFSTWSRAC